MASEQIKVTTGKVRFSYVNLFTARAIQEGQTPKYGLAILIDKSTDEGKATYKKLRAAEEKAKERDKAKWGGKVPAKLRSSIHDADDENDGADLEKNPEYAGHWYMNVSNERKPGVVDSDMSPILDPSEIYSGCYGRVSLSAYGYATAGNKGVGFGLRNVQKLSDGEALGGVSNPEDDFDAVDEDEDLI